MTRCSFRAVVLTAVAVLAGVVVARAATWPRQEPVRTENVWDRETSRNAFLARVLKRTEPVYPAEARAAGVEGTVTVRAYVSPAGRVRGMEIEESIPMLDRAALDCVRQWTFSTPEHDSERIEMQATIPVHFRLEGRPAGSAARRAGPGPGGDWDVPRAGWYSDMAHLPRGQSIELHHGSRDSLWIESPNRWKSAGMFADSTYHGTLAWWPNAPDSLYRGAHGTLVAKLMPDSSLDARFAFGPKGPPPYSLNLKQSIQDGPSFSWTVQMPTPIRHPLWRPAGDSTATQEEHPTWPPTRSKPNADIVPATSARADSPGR